MAAVAASSPRRPRGADGRDALRSELGERPVERLARTHHGVGLRLVDEVVAAEVDRRALHAVQLGDDRRLVVGELNAVQGSPADLGGYYVVDKAKTDAVMRPSQTFNRALAEF